MRFKIGDEQLQFSRLRCVIVIWIKMYVEFAEQMKFQIIFVMQLYFNFKYHNSTICQYVNSRYFSIK